MQSAMPITFKTGGLGHLLVEDVYEAWVCVARHACSDPVNEVRLPFAPFRASFFLATWSGIARPLFADVGMRACVDVHLLT